MPNLLAKDIKAYRTIANIFNQFCNKNNIRTTFHKIDDRLASRKNHPINLKDKRNKKVNKFFQET